MADRYFQNLPNLIYSDTLCKDITKRVKLVDTKKNSPYSYYPYTIKDQLRSDQISEYYFGTPYLDWLIYLSNGIIDPYYGWYLSEQDFDSFILEKYGSYETSIKKIKYEKLQQHFKESFKTPKFCKT